MYKKTIKNVKPKSFLKKIFTSSHIDEIALSEDGFVIFMDDSKNIPLYFKDIRLMNPSSYIVKDVQYYRLTIVMKNNKCYEIDVLEREDMDILRKHFADYRWDDIFSRM